MTIMQATITATPTKVYPATDYAISREKIREYAAAVGEDDPLHFDPAAARAAGFADVVAPSMFAVVYAGKGLLQVLGDSEVAIDLARVVHGAQEFVWGEPVVAGDEITTVCRLAETFERGGNQFYVVRTDSRNQRGDAVATGTWTLIARGH
jgi:acyl dehydratase